MTVAELPRGAAVTENRETSLDRPTRDPIIQAAAGCEPKARPEEERPGDPADGDQGNRPAPQTEADVPGAPEAAASGTEDEQRDGEVATAIAAALDSGSGPAFLRRLSKNLSHLDIDGGALAPLMRQLRIDLRDHDEEIAALEHLVDALDDPALISRDLMRAVPVLAALTARVIVKGLAPGFGDASADAFKPLALAAITVTRRLVRNRRQDGLEPLPLVARTLMRRALRRGMQPAALVHALPRIALRRSGFASADP